MSDTSYSSWAIKLASLMPDRVLKYWGGVTREDYEKSAPLVDANLIQSKSSALVGSTDVPQFYINAADKRAAEIRSGESVYSPEKFIEGTSGMRAAVYRDPAGKTVLVFNGIAKPVPEIVQGKLTNTPHEKGIASFMRGAAEVLTTGAGLVGKQTREAVELYKSVLEDPNTKGLQVIGYSLGSLPAGEIAARFGQNAITISDLGLPQNRISADRAANSKAHTNLFIKGDPLVGITGPSTAQQLDITTEGGPKGHFPSVYAAHAKMHTP